MASESKYVVVFGRVQKFGDKPAITEREVNGDKVRSFTIKTSPKQQLVSCSLWGNAHGDVVLGEGDFVAIEGKYSLSTGNQGQEFHNISITDIGVIPAAPKKAREVVNRQAAADDTSDLF